MQRTGHIHAALTPSIRAKGLRATSRQTGVAYSVLVRYAAGTGRISDIQVELIAHALGLSIAFQSDHRDHAPVRAVADLGAAAAPGGPG